MGEVFLAQDTELDRPVALKIMSTELARDPNQRKRFRTEARAASGLNHPHICVIHQVGETEDGRPFLAMEYIDGKTLDVILRERRLKIREIIELGIQVAEALQAAHARGLVHRDIKPANIMLTRESGAKVLDFGLAKWFEPDELSATSTSVAHTRTGMLIGTPQYMSPEQALGRALDPKSDIFSLGVVLYELLVGQRPFLGRTAGEVINNVVNQPAAPLGPDNLLFSPALDRIVLKCLEKEPQNRHPSAAALASELRQLKEDAEKVLSDSAAGTSPQGVCLTPPAGSRPGEKVRTSKPALAFGLGLALLAVLGIASWLALHGRTQHRPVADPARFKSVAVLPFVNMSADKGDEYLSDGMTEELLNALARIPGLRVPGRSSSFAFKGRNEEGVFRKVGELLQVQTVLEGSVRKAGDKLRVTAQLISAQDGFHLWSDTYDRDVTNILGIQSDIASRVAAALKVQLLGAPREPTANIEAYKLYLQGRHLWNQRTGATIKQAIEVFNRAIAKDPAYAAAYAGLADCYAILNEYASLPSRETFPKAQAAALKALEMDSTLAEPHAVLGCVKAATWDWDGAEHEFGAAIAMNPNYATAHQWYGFLHRSRDDWDKALAEVKQAQEADPFSPIINVNVAAFLYYGKGDRHEAIKMLENLVELDPGFAVARNDLAWTYLQERRPAEALRQLEGVRALAGEPFSLDNLGLAYVFLGRTNDAQNVLAQLREFQTKGSDTRVNIAWVQYGLGDIGGTLDTLEQACAEHAQGLDCINYDPFWKDLRPHPRVQTILRKMNLVK